MLFVIYSVRDVQQVTGVLSLYFFAGIQIGPASSRALSASCFSLSKRALRAALA